LPQSKLQDLKRLRADWERAHPEPRGKNDWDAHAREVFSQEETWLDEGYGTCQFREARHAAHLAEGLLHFQEIRYFVSSWVIMANHCHVVMQPFDGQPLEAILKGLKGTVARQINAAVSGAGALWQQDIYDRIVRD
jgi:hypothetical protein